MQQYRDKELTCVDCGATFQFSVRDQEFFAQKGYTNEPKRCPACRASRKSRIQGGGSTAGSGDRQMYPAVCADCGKETMVPFEPKEGRPVYCRDCYSARGPRR